MEEKDHVLDHRVVEKLRFCGHFLHYHTGGKAGQGRILTAMLEYGDMTQRQLQDILGLRSGSISEILAKIEEAQYIEREKSTEDKRQLKLRLTKSGREKSIQMAESYDTLIGKLFTCLSEKEEEQLYTMLDKIELHWNLVREDKAMQAIIKELEK